MGFTDGFLGCCFGMWKRAVRIHISLPVAAHLHEFENLENSKYIKFE